uniref:40S ribosomal protein S29 n=1 Tax=Equus asinus asinus TaxID=83772 RepID=A0A8C4L8I9_EQUAS
MLSWSWRRGALGLALPSGFVLPCFHPGTRVLHGLIRKYGLNMCCQCFCQYAKDIGFVKLD